MTPGGIREHPVARKRNTLFVDSFWEEKVGEGGKKTSGTASFSALVRR